MMTVFPSGYNILVLTSIYPADDVPKEWTPIVHYFAREWVKNGNEVKVINYVSCFSNIAYWIAQQFKEKISSKTGSIIGVRPLSLRRYQHEGVDVYRIPLKKMIPHGRFRKSEIKKAVQLTKAYCEQSGFIPDVIVSHWANPSLRIMMELKKSFGCRTAYIAHNVGHFELFGKQANICLQSIDKIGFRSAYIKQKFETEPKYIKPSFMCYSGIPTKYVDVQHKKVLKDVRRFIFVGTLIGRKYPAEIVVALQQSFGEEDFSMTYIGQGQESVNIKAIAKSLKVEKKIHLLGRCERDDVVRYLDESDVFVMISRSEAFGLVYLEAMARGCITIASRKEGFDGIIRDGINGYLCDAGNYDELASIITRIRQTPIKELQKISDAAIKTACKLTDEKATAYYLSQIVE